MLKLAIMELVTPSFGLIVWQTMTFLSVIVFIVSWIMILRTNKLEAIQKIAWLIGTLFLPVIGPVIFFVKYSSFREVHS
ncbi:PLDc N-terminal domain-containing protein [Pontibacter silvestris]|uniref:PLDc N-terminal domain-containing protein n=2 Tax=Pontibacter silvestris TaxID=2305183 RepID=A0ABW4WV15_9BACT